MQIRLARTGDGLVPHKLNGKVLRDEVARRQHNNNVQLKLCQSKRQTMLEASRRRSSL